MESQSLSCYQSRNNATQGHSGNTKLYSATDRKVSITEQMKVKIIKLHFYITNYYFILLPRHSLSSIQHIYYLGGLIFSSKL